MIRNNTENWGGKGNPEAWLYFVTFLETEVVFIYFRLVEARAMIFSFFREAQLCFSFMKHSCGSLVGVHVVFLK